MTDFFADLEGHLTDAARRRARRRWVPGRPVALAVAAGVAAVAVVFGALSAIEASRDPEVAAPGPVPAEAPPTCGSEQLPPALLKTIGVLRRSPTAQDTLPANLQQRVTGDLPGGRLEKVWTSDARRARVTEAGEFWVVPALRGPCERPEAVACVLWDDGRLILPACVDLDRLQDGELIAQGRLDGGRSFTVALVPDGATPDLVVGGIGVEGTIEGNVFVAAYEASDRDHEQAYLSSDPPAGQACSDAGATLTRAAPADSVTSVIALFRDPGPLEAAPEGIWSDVLAGHSAGGVHAAEGVDLGVRGGYSFQIVPVGNLASECPRDYDPAAPDNRPGVCIGHRRGDGAATETGAGCWTIAQVLAGQAVGFQGLDDGRILAYAVLDDSVKGATLAGRRLEVDRNFGYVVLEGERPAPRLELFG